MKKRVIGCIAIAVLALGLTACGSNDKKEKAGGDEKEVTLKVGASATPHGEILEYVKPQLEKEGVNLDIVIFDDYVQPNLQLAEKEIDANYFQHIPFYELAVKENDYDFVNKGAIHIELMALYSNRIKDVKDLKEGATIIASNSEADWGRIITILQDADLVKVKDGVDLLTATFDDIEENPKNLKFKYDVNPEILAAAYENDEADLIAINANFAGGIELTPEKDGVLVEKDNSPYGNIVAARGEDKDNKAINKLIKVLRDKDTQDWIEKKWDGKIKPVSK